MCLYVRDLGMAEGRQIQQILRRSKNRIKVRKAQVVLASNQGFKVPAIAEMLHYSGKIKGLRCEWRFVKEPITR